MQYCLDEGWTFQKHHDTTVYPATVPGCVHIDLLRNDLIPDPYYRMNEHDLQWIDKEDWVYQTTFTPDPQLFSKEQISLHFKGLDTYADVFLNDSLILQANNMFREWNVEVKRLLQPIENELTIVFHSPIMKGLALYNNLNFEIPVSTNDNAGLGGLGDKRVSAFIRKAPYHFGWDWGPRFVTSGIWRPVIIEGWDKAIIRDVFIRQDSLRAGFACATAIVEIESEKRQRLLLSFDNGKGLMLSKNVDLIPGLNTVMFPFRMTDYKLWWPSGLGDPHRYTFHFSLSENRSLLSSKIVTTGFRTIELVQDPDSAGKEFYFKVNGVPVFMKGANYIPQDVFPSRVSKDQYRKLLQDAAGVHMNMIRVWGGGFYEEDIFYDICDSLGLLVWQDFMFSCSMYPGDEVFMDNVEQEAVDNVKRLRNHPSLALWCGNNENLIAWESWGWKKETSRKFGRSVADTIWAAYERLFHHLLPEVVQERHPGIPYWPSSPGAGWGEKQNFNAGDNHYWMVWWGGYPFESYTTDVGRFMSEYGFQSFPLLPSINKFAVAEDHDIYSAVMQSHQRSSIGNVTIANYMERYYKVPASFGDVLYVSQLLQARAMKIAIEAHRINRPYCMGSLYWQLNDCWPAASWSGIDYFGQWKALHYQVKRSFSPVLVSVIQKDDALKCYVVSDEMKPRQATLRLSLMDFAGNIKFEHDHDMKVEPSTAMELPFVMLSLDGITGDSNTLVMRMLLEDSTGEVLSENLHYWVHPRALQLPEARIAVKVVKSDSVYIVRLLADKLAKDVYLQLKNPDEGLFSDNFFDLLPGHEKVITYSGKIKPDFTIRTLKDTY